ncbi:hypothetical protein EG346_22165 [Chryseobacterium carnipullorum]|uniref:Uncharacterized protein n=1 Tax=Chryseobacterium carnipullorum TaxID=1124835 RepID=A0A3G6M4W0_CHRCU|nr:hypothetical protein [Chryseobacterium carnipullorum]AZA50710.1 hypothetical protein EG346_22165 [Chryseobacterium carnipullorum]AZA65576.1 hypothetical protein EG345_13260 [Chryseobacterium carnipullorum]
MSEIYYLKNKVLTPLSRQIKVQFLIRIYAKKKIKDEDFSMWRCFFIVKDASLSRLKRIE